MLLLLGTSCGLGVIVAIFIPFIASYNRVSIFLMFASVLTVVLGGERFLDKSMTDKKKRILVVAAIVVLFLVSFVEQMRSYNHFSDTLLEDNSTKLAQDKTFFAKLEESAGTNGMVFVLPYMSAFENLQQGNIYDYDHYRGYLNTNTIRWSYGAVNGRKNDAWYKSTSELEPDAMIKELRDKGYGNDITVSVDDAEYVLQNLLGCKIDAITINKEFPLRGMNHPVIVTSENPYETEQPEERIKSLEERVNWLERQLREHCAMYEV